MSGAFFETAALRLLAGVWCGMLAGFLLAARAAFAVLPTRELAGDVVTAMLNRLDVLGLVAGPLAAVLLWRLGGGAAGNWRLILPVLATGVAALSRFWLTPKLLAIRAAIPGSIDDLSRMDPLRQSFGRWHGVSFLLLMVEIAALGILLAAGAPAPRSSA